MSQLTIDNNSIIGIEKCILPVSVCVLDGWMNGWYERANNRHIGNTTQHCLLTWCLADWDDVGLPYFPHFGFLRQTQDTSTRRTLPL